MIKFRWLLCGLAALVACEPPILSPNQDSGAKEGDLSSPPSEDLRPPSDGALQVGDLGTQIDSGVTRYPHAAVASPITAAVKQRLRAIAATNASRQEHVFLKAGASGTVSTNLLFCFSGSATPQYTLALDGRDALLPSIEHFRLGQIGQTTPFNRVTLAAKVGSSAVWAITGSPSPLEQEITASNPRFAFVNYGTNDMGQAATYQAALFPFYDNMSSLLDQLEQGGIVPIVSGLNPRGDSAAAELLVPTWDVVTRALAEARQLPYISLFRMSLPLAKLGLLSDGLHGNVYVDGKAQPCMFTAEGLAFNYNARNLASIEALDAVRKVVLDDAAAPSTVPIASLVGSGTASDPFVIDGLPFSHSFSTSGGQRLNDNYPGCGATQNESGPEISYKLALAAQTPLRILVFDRGTVDVDLHLLTNDACVARNDRLIERTQPQGEHRIVVDTFVSGGTEHAGEYLLVVVPCEAGDTSCQ